MLNATFILINGCYVRNFSLFYWAVFSVLLLWSRGNLDYDRKRDERAINDALIRPPDNGGGGIGQTGLPSSEQARGRLGNRSRQAVPAASALGLRRLREHFGAGRQAFSKSLCLRLKWTPQARRDRLEAPGCDPVSPSRRR
jgi:hypothetical protein